MEWLDTSPRVAVTEAEYRRLLGFPADHPLDERATELMGQSAEWYAKNGRPWVYARLVESVDHRDGRVRVQNMEFASAVLAEQMREAQAGAAVIVLVSAGAECETRAAQLWAEEKPDEYFFQEIYGSAVAESLVQQAGARLCAWADPQRLAVLPHYSPGYTGWNVADQVRLFELARAGSTQWPEHIRVRESGMLQPKKSLLALFGLTAELEKARVASALIPCQTCSFEPCDFRRAPFARARLIFEDVGRLQPLPVPCPAPAPRPGLSSNASYVTSTRALKKWAAQRLQLSGSDTEGFTAIFRYEGTTCSNMGWPLLFDYRLRLGPAADGYRILEAKCGPAREDTGHTKMCAYIRDGEGLLHAVRTESPLVGKPLESVLTWSRPHNPAGCYCDDSSRAHKWGLVFEVLHFALANRRVG